MIKAIRKYLLGRVVPPDTPTKRVRTRLKRRVLSVGEYDPNLIPRLKDDHECLIDIYCKIRDSALKNNPDVTRAEMVSFKRRLTGHLIAENHNMYEYMKSSISDPTAVMMIREAKSDMDEIGENLLIFFNKFIDQKSSIDSSFLSQLKDIGDVLNERIALEERDIYPTYLPKKRSRNEQ